jgi:hypothetical protein
MEVTMKIYKLKRKSDGKVTVKSFNRYLAYAHRKRLGKDYEVIVWAEGENYTYTYDTKYYEISYYSGRPA